MTAIGIEQNKISKTNDVCYIHMMYYCTVSNEQTHERIGEIQLIWKNNNVETLYGTEIVRKHSTHIACIRSKNVQILIVLHTLR